MQGSTPARSATLRPPGEAQISNSGPTASALSSAKAPLIKEKEVWVQSEPQLLICQATIYQQLTGGGGHA